MHVFSGIKTKVDTETDDPTAAMETDTRLKSPIHTVLLLKV